MDEAIKNWLKQAKDAGLSNEEITKKLLDDGWDKDKISEMLHPQSNSSSEEQYQQRAPQQEKTKKKLYKIWWFWVILFMSLIILPAIIILYGFLSGWGSWGNIVGGF